MVRAGAAKVRRGSNSEWSYYAGVDEIFHARWLAVTSARLHAFREALKHFWPPPGGYPVKLVQVAGTSGKGSTCKFLQSGLSLYGRAGCYVKPHVFDYAERFTVETGQVSHEEIASAWFDDVKPYFDGAAVKGPGWALDHPETSLLIALRIFERHRLDWAAVETGLGGRYDPVTELKVSATVLTNVGRDHEDVLGSEHWQRALDKAGVCRPGVPLVLADADPRTVEVVQAVARERGTPLLRVTQADVRALERGIQRARTVRGQDIVFGARHQLLNATAAVRAIGSLVGREDLPRLIPRLLETKYVGRFWKVGDGVYADVAHNPSKTQALAEEVEERFPNQKKVFVIGISGQRNPAEVVRPLVTQAKAMVVTGAGYKGQPPAKVMAALRDSFPMLPLHLAPETRTALNVAMGVRGRDSPIIFTGSTYMIDQALNPDERLRHLNGSYGWREQTR